MKIIHIVLGKAHPKSMNGVNKAVNKLATQQSMAGKVVEVWGITKSPVHDYEKRNFTTHLFEAFPNPFSVDPHLLNSLQGHMKNTIFHFHGGWFPAYYSISVLLTDLRIPYIITPHGSYNTLAMKKNKWAKRIYFHLYEKKLIENAYKIHCIGQSEVEGLNSLYPTKKTFLQPFGLEIPSSEQKFTSAKAASFTVGYVGRLDIFTKGLDLLIDAYSQFNSKDKNTRLWIVGDGEERPKLEKIIAQKGVENVRLWGSEYGLKKDGLLKAMDVFAHPSRNEGLPVSVLEAAAMGVPSVVTQATNVGDSISQYKSGIAVENENVEALSQAFTKLKKRWDQNKLNEMSQNAYKMINHEYSWNRIVHRFDKLYQ